MRFRSSVLKHDRSKTYWTVTTKIQSLAILNGAIVATSAEGNLGSAIARHWKIRQRYLRTLQEKKGIVIERKVV